MYISVLMISKSEFKFSGLRLFLGGKNMNFLFNSDIVNLLLKTIGDKDRRPNLRFFLFGVP